MESRDATHEGEKPQPKALVCLYAQRDEPMYRELQKYLILWENQSYIYWADPASIQQADLILLLLSSDFFVARGCQMGMARAFEVRTERGIPIVPVLARASNWKESACGALKALPDNDRPIVEWRQKERAYENICAGLARLLPDLPALGIAPPERPRLFQAPKLPDSYVARPNEFAAIKEILLNQQGAQTAAITTALRGAGGFGKTTLALALCYDPEIQKAFPDGILWVELGEHPPRAVEILNRVVRVLEPSWSRAVTLEEARENFRKTLQERVCLLVIDDVWQAEALKPLLEEGPQCVRLVTTRNDLLLPKDVTRVLVDAMEPSEAFTLLCQDLPEEISETIYQPQLEALVTRLGCWPLLLTLANGMLTDLVDYHLSIAEALTTLLEAYQTRGVTAFRLDNVEERQRTVDACLSVSIQHLEKFTVPHHRAAERYQELAVFPEDTDIPLTTLQVYWKGSVGLEVWETKDLCMRLHRLSLLLHCDLGIGTIRLHDVVRSYLIQCAGKYLPTLHARLLDACQQQYGLIRWADLPSDDTYLWQHLIWHLCHTGHQEALFTTLTDVWYLIHKALFVGLAALEADLLLAQRQEDTGTDVGALLSWLSGTIGRSSHMLRQVETEAELGGLLLSQLGEHPVFAAQQSLLEQTLPRPFLIAWYPLPAESASPQLLRTLRGHARPISHCAVSPDGQWIVSASYDRMLRVWDAATGAERFILKGHEEDLTRCAVSPDGRWIISTDETGKLKMWDAATGAQCLTFTGSTNRGKKMKSPDGKWIISYDSLFKVWDAATGALRLTLDYHTGPESGAVSPDGLWFVSASADHTLKVWDAATGTERLTIKGHTDRVGSCAVSPDGQRIVSTSADQTLKVWDAATGTDLLTLKGHTDRVRSCAVSPDGQRIVSTSEDHTLKVWDAATGTDLLTLKGHISGVWGCAVSPDGQWIVSASADHTLKVWDIKTLEFPSSVHFSLAPQSLQRKEERKLSWVGKLLNSVRDISAAGEAADEEQRSSADDTVPITSCAVSPNGRFIVSATRLQGRFKVWDTATGMKRLTSGPILGLNGCAISPNSKWIATASADWKLRVWNAVTGAVRLTLEGHTRQVNCCAFSPDGRWLISASEDRTIKVWNAATGAVRLTLEVADEHISGCAFSPDGGWIIADSSRYSITIWDATTGDERLTLSDYDDDLRQLRYGAMSPDGQSIIAVSGENKIKVWDVTGVKYLEGHTGPVNRFVVSPNSKWIVSVSDDCTLKVWDIQRGHCLLTFPVNGVLYNCAFHPDGEHLVVCGDQGMYFLRLVV